MFNVYTTASQWILAFHIAYTCIILTILVHSVVSEQVEHNTGQRIKELLDLSPQTYHLRWLPVIILYYTNPADWMLHGALFLILFVGYGFPFNKRLLGLKLPSTVKHTAIMVHLFIINQPTEPTIASVFFFLEMSSIFSFGLFIWFIYSLPNKKNHDLVFTPLAIFNFLTYILLLHIITHISVNPESVGVYDTKIATLGTLYVVMKLGLTPALFTKAVVYARLSSSQVVALAMPLLLVTLPNAVYLHELIPLLEVPYMLTTITAAVAITGASTVVIKSHTHALLLSTPLISIILFLGAFGI